MTAGTRTTFRFESGDKLRSEVRHGHPNIDFEASREPVNSFSSFSQTYSRITQRPRRIGTRAEYFKCP